MKKTAALIISLLAAAALSTQAADVKANWDQHCAKCHGADGKGKAAMKTKDYTDPKVQAELKDDEMLKVIKEGKGKMKGYADKLSEDENKAFIQFIRDMKKK